jgi:hypothetical protein
MSQKADVPCWVDNDQLHCALRGCRLITGRAQSFVNSCPIGSANRRQMTPSVGESRVVVRCRVAFKERIRDRLVHIEESGCTACLHDVHAEL